MTQDACDASVAEIRPHGLALGFRDSKRSPLVAGERGAARSRGAVDGRAPANRALLNWITYAIKEYSMNLGMPRLQGFTVSNFGRVPGRRLLFLSGIREKLSLEVQSRG
jgi:hypothetical protein